MYTGKKIEKLKSAGFRVVGEPMGGWAHERQVS